MTVINERNEKIRMTRSVLFLISDDDDAQAWRWPDAEGLITINYTLVVHLLIRVVRSKFVSDES